MKTILRYLIIIALSIAVSAHAQPVAKPDIDDTSRFIFYSVLEGLYEDGLSTKDVEQILMRKEKQTYFHFIYACPVCGATIWALEAYKGRPERLYGLKREGSTFGKGLSAELHEQLYSDDPQQRLIAINTLVKTWMERRMKAMNLSAKDRAALLEALEKKRKQGMDALESFRKLQHGPNFGVAEAAPAYVDLQECAVCNGAVGKPMKLPEPKPK
jgi:hypothetical protein